MKSLCSSQTDHRHPKLFQRDRIGYAVACLSLAGITHASSAAADWQPVEIPISSSFGEVVTPENALPDYPRPQMRRDTWVSLNGLWDYAIQGRESPAPTNYDGKILVPFCVQSSLSGVRKLLDPEEQRVSALWYQRSFEVPEAWRNQRVLLHFEAVDWETQVWINDILVGTHRGGYIPFSFDITEALSHETSQKLILRVTDSVGQEMGESVGKQADAEYESVTGIWQPVWLEPVPQQSIERLTLVPDIDRSELRVHPFVSGHADGLRIEAKAMKEGVVVARASGTATDLLTLHLPEARLWSPTDPFLYDLEVSLIRDGEVVDTVDSYFGMRKVSIGKVGTGNRILLNNEPLFMIGPLDQGFWPESILTPPSEAGLRYELEYLKEIGCNMVRPHIIVKPRRWYHACDQLGLMVWQDFVCGPYGKQSVTYDEAGRQQWLSEQRGMMEALYNHPSIVMWLVFNEGWGQHQIEEYTRWTGKFDPTRPVTAASGFVDVPGLGHVRDIHIYINSLGIAVPEYEAERAVTLGEWGGFNSVAKGHQWIERGWNVADDEWIKSINRPSYTIGAAFEAHYADAVEQLRYLKELGLRGAVYTQLTDMKKEQNGYLSIDRKVSKGDPEVLRTLHDSLVHDDVQTRPVIEASLIHPQIWKYTETQPEGDWTSPAYDDGEWKQAEGPFGITPPFVFPGANTEWTSDRLYLRKTFSLDEVPSRASLRTYVYGQFNEHYTSRIYLNGHKVKEIMRWHGIHKELQVLTVPLRPEALAHLRPGINHVAVEVDLPFAHKLFDLGIYAAEKER